MPFQDAIVGEGVSTCSLAGYCVIVFTNKMTEFYSRLQPEQLHDTVNRLQADPAEKRGERYLSGKGSPSFLKS